MFGPKWGQEALNLWAFQMLCQHLFASGGCTSPEEMHGNGLTAQEERARRGPISPEP